MARPTKEQQKRKKQYEYAAKYNKKATTMLSVRLHNENDQDILQHLGKQENTSAYIKKLIRADIEEAKSNN